MTALVSFQRGLTGKELAADRASEIFVYRQSVPIPCGQYKQLTITVRQEMTLQLGLLRERLVRPVTSLPATIIPSPLGSLHRGHMPGDQMLLQSTAVGKGRSAGGLDAVRARNPFAHVQVVVRRTEIWTRDDRGATL